MADGVFNVAKGQTNEYQNRVANNDPGTAVLVVVLLQAAVADGALQDFDDLASLLADAGNTEANFTNYARIEYTDSDVIPAQVNDTSNFKFSDIPDPVWASAGGTVDNSLVKLLICYDQLGTGVDANIVPCTYHDFVVTTNGTDLTGNVDTGGYFRAS